MSLEILKSAVSRKFGRRIINRPDCEQLSLEIYKALQVHLSYNTLRRIYDLADAKKHKASQETLNVLSRYVGYENFFQFSGLVSCIEPILREQEFLLNLQCQNEINKKEIIAFLFQDADRNRITRMLPIILLRAFENNDISFLTDFFEIAELFDDRFYLSLELFYSLQLIGLKLRNHDKEFNQKYLWNIWAMQSKGRLFYFELFVDMDYLNVSHLYAIQAYLKNASTVQETTFAGSLLFWSAFWSNDQKMQEHYLPLLNLTDNNLNIHPIPLARSLNCLLVYYKEKKEVSTQAILVERIKTLLNRFSEELDPFFHYWIIEGFVLTRNYNFCLEIIGQIEDNWSQTVQRYYHKGSNVKAQIIKCHCLVKLGKTKQAQKVYDKLNFDDCYTFSSVYDQLFLPKCYHSSIHDKAEELGYGKLLKLLV